jgi:hypothetical protein
MVWQSQKEAYISSIKRELLNHGLYLYPTTRRYQFLIYCIDHLGSRVINISNNVDGRLISIDLNINASKTKDYIRVTGCYAYPDGGKIYKDRTGSRNELRGTLYNKTKKLIGSRPQILKNASWKGDIFVGDLQETITRDTRDNQGGYNRKRLPNGILQATIEEGGIDSMVHKHDEQISYISRENQSSSSTGGRGISHILAKPDAEIYYMGGCIDPIVSASNITSDHYIVAADFDFNIQHLAERSINESEYKFLWGAVANIEVDAGEVLNDEDNPPVINFKADLPQTMQLHGINSLSESSRSGRRRIGAR